MVMPQKRYILTNTTVKPPRIDKQTGKDLRTASERNGHAVSYRDAQDKVMILHPNSPPHIVGEPNEGILRMYQEGLIGIKEVKDFAEILALRQQTGQRTERRGAKKAPTDVEDAAVAAKPSRRGKRAARVSEMGQDSNRQKILADEIEGQGAVNPDGVPNFVVQAPSLATRRRAEKALESSPEA